MKFLDIYEVLGEILNSQIYGKQTQSFSTSSGRVGRRPNIMLHCGWNRGNFRWMWQLGVSGDVGVMESLHGIERGCRKLVLGNSYMDFF